jgi:hypothetical protein
VPLDVYAHCLYNDDMSMITIRLNDRDADRARKLREVGIEISQLVREAIRSEYDRRAVAQKRGDTLALLDAIYRRHPEPVNPVELAPSPLNRKAFARHVRQRLARRASR